MIVKLLTEHHLEFLSLKAGYTGSSQSTLVKLLEISFRGSNMFQFLATSVDQLLVAMTTRELPSLLSCSPTIYG